jgi:hypothetical protein
VDENGSCFRSTPLDPNEWEMNEYCHQNRHTEKISRNQELIEWEEQRDSQLESWLKDNANGKDQIYEVLKQIVEKSVVHQCSRGHRDRNPGPGVTFFFHQLSMD